MVLSREGEGRVCMALSTLCFAAVGAVVRRVGPRASAQDLVLWRSLVSIVWTLIAHRRTIPAGPPPRHYRLLVLRGLCGHCALWAFFSAARQLPVATANFLGKIHPVCAALFAAGLLHEPLELRHAAGAATSLAGIWLIADLSVQSFTGLSLDKAPAALLAVGSGVGSGAAYCCVRGLALAGEQAHYVLLAFPVVSLAVLCGFGQGLSLPGLEMIGWVLLLGAFTQGGQAFLVMGMGRLPCATATQQMFLGSLFGVLLGVMLGEGWPALRTCIGGLMVLLGSTLVAPSAPKPD